MTRAALVNAFVTDAASKPLSTRANRSGRR